MLAAPTGIELFVRTPDALVRYELDRGRITTTGIPLTSYGTPTLILAATWSVVLLPLSAERRYLIFDGAPPVIAPGELGRSSFSAFFAGPSPDLLWEFGRDNLGAGGKLTLVGIDGVATTTGVDIGSAYPTMADGRGNVVIQATGGDYIAGPIGIQRLTTGFVAAIGESAAVTIECDQHLLCFFVIVDRDTGHRRVLGTATGYDRFSADGLVAPDGSMAALVRGTQNQELHLLDLSSGQDTTLATYFNGGQSGRAALAWSRDSRFLFFIDDQGVLQVLDRVTGVTSPLARDLGVVRGLVARPSP